MTQFGLVIFMRVFFKIRLYRAAISPFKIIKKVGLMTFTKQIRQTTKTRTEIVRSWKNSISESPPF